LSQARSSTSETANAHPANVCRSRFGQQLSRQEPSRSAKRRKYVPNAKDCCIEAKLPLEDIYRLDRAETNRPAKERLDASGLCDPATKVTLVTGGNAVARRWRLATMQSSPRFLVA
jgi:hypothetical protein